MLLSVVKTLKTENVRTVAEAHSTCTCLSVGLGCGPTGAGAAGQRALVMAPHKGAPKAQQAQEVKAEPVAPRVAARGPPAGIEDSSTYPWVCA